MEQICIKRQGYLKRAKTDGNQKAADIQILWPRLGTGRTKRLAIAPGKMTGAIANNGNLAASRFSLNRGTERTALNLQIKFQKQKEQVIFLSSFMKEQSASVSAATGLTVYGKTGSPERDKLIKKGNAVVRKELPMPWYTHFLYIRPR